MPSKMQPAPLPSERKTDLSDHLVFLTPPAAVAQQDTLVSEIPPWDLMSNISMGITFPRGSYKMRPDLFCCGCFSNDAGWES